MKFLRAGTPAALRQLEGSSDNAVSTKSRFKI